MSRRRQSSSDEGGNWMDTYGDMVTLLLTFFVMLYSMSSLNQQKWEIFVKSIIPNSGMGEEQQVAIDQEAGAGTYDVEGTMDTDVEPPAQVDMGKLYLALAQELDQNQIGGATVSRGDGYTFLVFEDQAFFDGDSSVLFAKSILDLILVLLMTLTHGRGCIFSFIPVVIVQGIITVLAGLIKPVMTHEAISALSLVGSVLIATLGINMVWDKHIRVSNLFPSVVVAVIWAFAAGI